VAIGPFSAKFTPWFKLLVTPLVIARYNVHNRLSADFANRLAYFFSKKHTKVLMKPQIMTYLARLVI